MRNGLWGLIDGTDVTPPPDAEPSILSRFQIRCGQATGIILLSLDTSVLYLIGEENDPAKAWAKLENQYQPKTWANVFSLKSGLYYLRMAVGDDIQAHFKRVKERCDELAVAGKPLEEEERVFFVLNGLPYTYAVPKTVLTMRVKAPTWDVVTLALINESKRHGAIPVSFPEACLATTVESRTCHYCHKIGHIRPNCPSKPRFISIRRPYHQGVERVNYSHRDDAAWEDFGLHVDEFQNRIEGFNINTTWFVDSGATSHMSGEITQFENFEQLEKNGIRLGNSHVLDAGGDIRLVSLDGTKCLLRGVLYVPALDVYLLSVAKVSEMDITTTFDCTGCVLSTSDGTRVLNALKKGNLYVIEGHGLVNKNDSSYFCRNYSQNVLWHRRLGHLGAAGMSELIKHGMLIGFPLSQLPSLP
eukprot:TCALIF_12428-PA protein Name:"Similar to Retrovirus-related Pol polyprotein from transposon TNT 1-94 (Nicotiana tabacum)" AED:0.02 eAED:0.05 QI:22/0/0/1/0/0/2/0/415